MGTTNRRNGCAEPEVPMNPASLLHSNGVTSDEDVATKCLAFEASVRIGQGDSSVTNREVEDEVRVAVRVDVFVVARAWVMDGEGAARTKSECCDVDIRDVEACGT